jgi:hypothetical protein
MRKRKKDDCGSIFITVYAIPLTEIDFAIQKAMSRKKRNTEKRRRGRPATGQMPVFPLRLPDTVLDDVDDWIQKEGVKMSRSEAIRRLLALGLAATGRKR